MRHYNAARHGGDAVGSWIARLCAPPGPRLGDTPRAAPPRGTEEPARAAAGEPPLRCYVAHAQEASLVR